MCRFLLGFVVLLATAGAASAQTESSRTAAPRFDLNFSIGGFTAQEEVAHADPYDDDWYSEGRYAVGVGYYWTRHFKTELEFATTGEGSHYVHEIVRVPGTPYVQPISIESFHRIQHTSVRAVWEFLPNTWVQPYLNAGGILQIDRQRYHSPAQYYYPVQPDPRNPAPPINVRREVSSGPTTDYRGGVTGGGGAKFFVSTGSYINTGMQITYAKPVTTVSFVAGFGIEF